MYYLNLVLVSVIFFFPAYAANSLPVVANGLKLFPSLNKPIHKTLFGKSKTYRGFVVGMIGALLVGLIQYYSGWYSQLEYSLLLAFLLGFGALLGDLIKSFIKRRIGIKSGDPWIIFDQIDYVIGGVLLAYIINPVSLEIIITLLVISPLLSLGSNMISYSLKIKKVWW
ncbi:CDP-2,3-bis-(O-geranylgeranyl)-sn-glycerol synthase [Patescibacteria group bacterium]